jgi:drug/metabolite transporter (DMT)-like permease
MTQNGTRRRRIGADLILLLVTLIWGGTFVMVKGATANYPIFPFLTLRFALATGALLLVGARRLRTLGWRGWGMGALLGLALFAGYALQTVGLRYTSASKSGLITGLSVVIVPLLAAWIQRRSPGAATILGVILATLGLVLLTVTDSFRLAPGDLFLLGCALSFALHIVGVGVYAPKVDALALTIVQLATVTLISAIVSLATHKAWPATPQPVWLAAAFTGVLATAAAFLAQTGMQRFTTPTPTALVFAPEPVFAAMFGVLLSGDVLTLHAIIGGVLIVLGNLGQRDSLIGSAHSTACAQLEHGIPSTSI